MEVTIPVPESFIKFVKGTQVWKDEGAGLPFTDTAIKKFYILFLTDTGFLENPIDKHSMMEWVNENDDILYDEIYEAHLF